jgi:primosomal protein N' (replication factor Y)
VERLTLFVDIIVPLAVPKKYTYRVPVELNDSVEIGRRALVQFGKAKFYSGIIASIHQNSPQDYTAKYIDSLIDESPVVIENQLKLWDWISFYYMCGPGEVMNAALPSALKLSSVSNIQLNSEFNFEEIDHGFFTDREHLIIDALHHAETMSFEDVANVLKVKAIHPVIHNLIRKKAISVYEEIKDKYKPKLVSFLQLNAEYKDESKLKELLDGLEKKAFKQAEVLLYFLHLNKTHENKDLKWIRKSELLSKFENSPINALVKKNVLTEQQFEVGRLLFENSESIKKELNPTQEKTLEEIKDTFKKHDVTLLHGVTGSGKTEIYARMIKETMEQGKQVLYLLPEIALTTQLITRMRAYFGERVGVYHSKFSENERVEIWNNVLHQNLKLKDDFGEDKKHYSIVLGARSALFLPFKNLGLIIVDEEHDNSFKQHDPSPRYHARDTAIYLATLHKAKVLLGSATPSLESYQNAQKNKFGFVELNKKFNESYQNETVICDVKYFEFTHQKKSIVTPPLFEAIEKALKNKEQVILFQNRRGFAPYTECHSCGWIPHCVQCDVSLIYHKQSNKLQCHYCGYSIAPPSTCNACGHNDLRYKGMGTEKAEEEIEILFPEAKIARMDLDTTRSKFAYKQIIDDFEEGNIDILIGTQMVTKGLDFDHVSVVGILNADTLLNFPDFRSHEKAYQLITQVSGRAGRKNKQGKVFIQTSQPNHPLLQQIMQGNIKSFLQNQLIEREQYHYPPFSRLIELKVVSKDINVASSISEELATVLRPLFQKDLLGPEFPLVSKIKNQFYKRIVLKIDRSFSVVQIREVLNNEINNLFLRHKTGQFKVQIDVDPN